MNPDEEIRKLKLQFELWKKEYKIRLRETKTKRHQLGHSEAVKKKKIIKNGGKEYAQNYLATKGKISLLKCCPWFVFVATHP